MLFSPSTCKNLYQTGPRCLRPTWRCLVCQRPLASASFSCHSPISCAAPSIWGSAVNTASMMEAVRGAEWYVGSVVGHAVWAVCGARGGVQRGQDALHIVPAWQPFTPLGNVG